MPNFEVLDAKIASALNRIIHQHPLQEKDQSGGTKSPKRVPPPRKTDSLPDLRILPGHGTNILSRIMRTYLQLFFEMMTFRNSIQNGTEFYYQ